MTHISIPNAFPTPVAPTRHHHTFHGKTGDRISQFWPFRKTNRALFALSLASLFLSFAHVAEADPQPGVYVSKGLRMIADVEPCTQTRDRMCLRLRHGARVQSGGHGKVQGESCAYQMAESMKYIQQDTVIMTCSGRDPVQMRRMAPDLGTLSRPMGIW